MTWDCPYGEDEEDCSHFRCSGLFWCPIEKRCLSFLDVCDGKTECIQSNIDERFCEEMHLCPVQCFCVGYAVHCINGSLKGFPALRRKVTSLLLRNNAILYVDNSIPLKYILHLDLSFNSLLSLQQTTLNEMKYLIYFNIAFNKIKSFDKRLFLFQAELKYFEMTSNPLQSMDPLTFVGLSSLQTFFLVKTLTTKLCNYCFMGLTSVVRIEIRDCKINSIEKHAFANLTFLKEVVIQDNKIKEFDIRFIDIFHEPFNIQTDLKMICCKINRFKSSKCVRDDEYPKVCLLKNLSPFWYSCSVLVILLNAFASLLRKCSDSDTSAFDTCINSLSSSQVLQMSHYLFRSFMNSSNVKIIIGSNLNVFIFCSLSALTFPLSLLIQLSAHFCYTICYLRIVLDKSVPPVVLATCISIVIWLICLALSYIILHTGQLMEEICFPYSPIEISVTYVCFLLFLCISSTAITSVAIRRTEHLRKQVKRKITKNEQSLRVRMISQAILSTIQCGIVAMFYIIISSSHRVSQAVLVSMDSVVFIKAISDPILHTLSSKSHWQSNQVRDACRCFRNT